MKSIGRFDLGSEQKYDHKFEEAADEEFPLMGRFRKDDDSQGLRFKSEKAVKENDNILSKKDMENFVSDAVKDDALSRYQYFVGNDLLKTS
ncbi:MAG: hypothetical protein K5931_00615 [Lachnospiraceae bacterium]|nr:hypothetical protein [Lachnospiraceae bacterium]